MTAELMTRPIAWVDGRHVWANRKPAVTYRKRRGVLHV